MITINVHDKDAREQQSLIIEKFRKWRDYLCANVIGREDEINAILYAALSRHHVALIGPPGEAKSMLARYASKLLAGNSVDGGGYFEYLFTRYTEPKELFGPPDIKAFKDQGVYRHVVGTTGSGRTLATARVAFLDEAFKANSGILNALLGILNERAFNNGPERITVPLRFALLASNEFPQEDCEALWDRCLVRLGIDPLEDDDLLTLLTRGKVEVEMPEPFTDDEIEYAVCYGASMKLACAPELIKLNKELAQQGVEVSTRRWVWATEYMRSISFFSGNTEVSAEAILDLEPVLWRTPEQRPAITQVLEKFTPAAAMARELKTLVEEAKDAFTQFENAPPANKIASASNIVPRIKTVQEKLGKMKKVLKSGTKNYETADNADKACAQFLDELHKQILNKKP